MFDRAQSRLVLLKETEEVTARDILDVFRDLCSDVSQEGKKEKKLPPGDGHSKNGLSHGAVFHSLTSTVSLPPEWSNRRWK